jgi:hypothetical protein
MLSIIRNDFDLIAIETTQKFWFLLASFSPGRNYLNELKFCDAKLNKKREQLVGSEPAVYLIESNRPSHCAMAASYESASNIEYILAKFLCAEWCLVRDLLIY